MSNVSVKITNGAKSYSAQVMTIKSTSLGYEDHGIWTAFLSCQGEGTGIGVGGYTLDGTPATSPLGDNRRSGSAYGMDHIMRLCETVGVSKWEDLPGKKVYVLFEDKGNGSTLGMTAQGIANIDTGKVLDLKDHAQAWKDKVG